MVIYKKLKAIIILKGPKNKIPDIKKRPTMKNCGLIRINLVSIKGTTKKSRKRKLSTKENAVIENS